MATPQTCSALIRIAESFLKKCRMEKARQHPSKLVKIVLENTILLVVYKNFNIKNENRGNQLAS